MKPPHENFLRTPLILTTPSELIAIRDAGAAAVEGNVNVKK